ncbi:alcohol dehydrogenase catalytic domain-containing protein [Cryptosporangium sp. NPDC048952]|uniref:alcohol dehydrogenase catalytic domain-containing protein n=1 Tax=Cryptosporangium sp. NPDC048952 TaxID=3363961 RepID=UPI0037225400
MEVRSLPDPVPGPGDLVIAVRGAGICGTDIHLIDGDLPYQRFPVVPGHEFYGEVVATGAEVDSALVGTLVAVDPNIACHACAECRRGRSNLCLNYEALGVTLDGGTAELVRAPAKLAYQLPGDITHAGALLVEPLSCAIHGLDVLPRRVGDRYLIYGAGTMGLLVGLLAGDLSPEPVAIVEPNPRRRAVAQLLGLAAVAQPDDLDQQWDSVIDCTGVVSAIEDGLTRVRPGGTFQCFGVAQTEAVVKVRPFEVYRNEISIVGSMAVLHSFDRAIRIARAWGDRLAPLVTHQFSLGEYAEAVSTFRAGDGLKLAIHPNGEVSS